MKLVCFQQELSNALQIVSKASGGKVLDSLYRHILLKATGNELILIGTGGELVIKKSIPVENLEETGELAVPGMELLSLIINFPPGLVTLRKENTQILISNEGIVYRLHTLSPELFPPLPTIEEGNSFQLSGLELKELIRETSFAVAPAEEIKSSYKGVLIEGEEQKLIAVATDTRRLCVKTIPTITPIKKPFKVIVPKRALVEIQRNLTDEKEDTVKIEISGPYILFQKKTLEILSHLIEGEFIDYRTVLPKRDAITQVITLFREEVNNALKRASIMAQGLELPNLVRLSLKSQTLIITAETQDLGQAYEEVSIREETKPLEIMFNSRYLLEVLGVLSCEEIRVSFTNSEGPILIQPVGKDNYIYLAMPIKLEEE